MSNRVASDRLTPSERQRLLQGYRDLPRLPSGRMRPGCLKELCRQFRTSNATIFDIANQQNHPPEGRESK